MSRTTVLINLLDDNPWQVREVYDPAYLEDLAADILKNGLLQPPLARMNGNGILSYQLAFGHCRLRAYQHLHAQGHPGFDTMPMEVRPLTDEQMADFAWTENEQRRDVTPIERMHAIRKQMETFGWTQKEIAERRGLSEATVSNILRLGQLPEDVQAKVHAGELSERAALPLLTYYSLPQPLREAAAKKTYVDNPEKFAREGRSSDDIRNAVKNVITQTALILPDEYINQPFEGPRVLAATCATCANHFLHNNAHYCGEQTRACYNDKKEAGKRTLLTEASQLTGVPILENGTDYKVLYQIMESSPTHLASLHPTPDHSGILAQGCEHLRLRLDNTALARESLADKKFHNVVGVVCCNPTGECACAKAMHLARAEQQENTPPTANINPQQEAQAERERRLNAFRATFLAPTVQAILPLILNNDLGFWRMIVFKMTSFSADQAEQLSLEQCQAEIAERLAWSRLAPYDIQNNPEGALATLNATRARLGLEPLEMPEDPHATPAEKLLRRLERIESYLERCAEGADEMTFQAAEGNLANLEKIKAEYITLPSADQDRDFLVRLELHLESLSVWLDAYDAESDEDEDEDEEEEEDLEEAYA